MQTGKTHRGGHFAAMEQTEVLAQEIREFFRTLRALASSAALTGGAGPRASLAQCPFDFSCCQHRSYVAIVYVNNTTKKTQ